MSSLPDVDALATYGGALLDYWPVTDPTRDRPAAGANLAYASIAAATHTVPRAWARLTLAATTGSMVLVAHDANWGNAAPVAPTVARTGTGVFTVTWPATVTDELSSVHALNIRAAWGRMRTGAAPYFVQTVPTSGNVVTIYVWNASGAANDAANVDVDVWWL